jgi:hypothetical protein
VRHCARGVIAIVAVACGNGTTAGTESSAAPTGGQAGSTAPSTTGAPAQAVSDAPASSDAPAAVTACEQLEFAASTPVPEASGAAWLAVNGKPALVVVSDSGNDGAYGIVDADTGATIETGKLPLTDAVSDDVEGVATRGDRLYGITSSGWIMVWQRKGKRFQRIGEPYPLGPVDLPDTMNNDRAPEGEGMVCKARGVNCGRNYEGLCLAPSPRGGCVGFAASKADGHLYCLTEDAGKLVVDRRRAISVARPGALADCTFSDDGTLWAGNNMFDIGNVYRVTGWDEPAKATVEMVASLAIGFPELLAVRGDDLYRMSDMGGAPSLMMKHRCPR